MQANLIYRVLSRLHIYFFLRQNFENNSLTPYFYAEIQQALAEEDDRGITFIDIYTLWQQEFFRERVCQLVAREAQDPEVLQDSEEWLVLEIFAYAKGVYADSLAALEQQGWLDVLPASGGNDLLIRLQRFPPLMAIQPAR